jgi:hypothetical protein
VQQRDLHDRIDAREVGAMLPRQADGDINALCAAFAVVEMHKQVFVGHKRTLSDDWNW